MRPAGTRRRRPSTRPGGRRVDAGVGPRGDPDPRVHRLHGVEPSCHQERWRQGQPGVGLGLVGSPDTPRAGLAGDVPRGPGGRCPSRARSRTNSSGASSPATPGPARCRAGRAERPRPESRSLGSGFIVSRDGYILTNAHVVDGADEITVKLTDKREFKAKVIGADKRTDMALLKIEATGLPAVNFGDPSKLKVGEWVVAIGSPFGFENTVTAGIVSAKGRSLPQENFVPFIQTDVAINPGNSGGPLFNMRGEVVGINSQIYSRTGGYMGLSFAIPIDVALDIQKQLREKGRVARGRIGVVIQEVTRDLADSFGLRTAARRAGELGGKGRPGRQGGRRGRATSSSASTASRSTRSSDLPRMVGATRPGQQVDAGSVAQGADAQAQRDRGRDAGRARRLARCAQAQAAGRGAGEPPGHRGGGADARSRRSQLKLQTAWSSPTCGRRARPRCAGRRHADAGAQGAAHRAEDRWSSSTSSSPAWTRTRFSRCRCDAGRAMAFVTVSGLTDKG